MLKVILPLKRKSKVHFVRERLDGATMAALYPPSDNRGETWFIWLSDFSTEELASYKEAGEEITRRLNLLYRGWYYLL